MIFTKDRQSGLFLPRERPLTLGSGGQVMLDDNGRVMLDPSGKVMLANASGTCPECCEGACYYPLKDCETDALSGKHIITAASGETCPAYSAEDQFYEDSIGDCYYYEGGTVGTTTPGDGVLGAIPIFDCDSCGAISGNTCSCTRGAETCKIIGITIEVSGSTIGPDCCFQDPPYSPGTGGPYIHVVNAGGLNGTYNLLKEGTGCAFRKIKDWSGIFSYKMWAEPDGVVTPPHGEDCHDYNYVLDESCDGSLTIHSSWNGISQFSGFISSVHCQGDVDIHYPYPATYVWDAGGEAGPAPKSPKYFIDNGCDAEGVNSHPTGTPVCPMWDFRGGTTKTTATVKCPSGIHRMLLSEVKRSPLKPLKDAQKWGPPLWRELHRYALTPEARKPGKMREKVLSISRRIPEGCSCRSGIRKYMRESPPDGAEPFAWSVEFHNWVNEKPEVNKPRMGITKARSLYRSL